MGYLGKAQSGIITVLLIAILVLLAWFFFLKSDPCVQVATHTEIESRFSNWTAGEKFVYNLTKSEKVASSEQMLKWRYACARSLK